MCNSYCRLIISIYHISRLEGRIMNNNILNIGSPPSIIHDYNTGSLVTYFKKTSSSLHDLWRDKLKQTETYRLYLSGGIDSQFTASVLKQLGLKFNTVIFDLQWDYVTVNSHDLLVAKRFAELNGIEYEIKTINLKELFESEEYVDLAIKYRIDSPQIAVHMKMLEVGNNDSDINMLGGDVPVLKYSKITGQAAPSANMSKSLVTCVLSGYYMFGQVNNVPVIKDLFRESDELLYAATLHNVSVLENYKIYFDETNIRRSLNSVYKKIYYESLGASILDPMIKSTGFETLKKKLMEETGIYNRFDQLYRFPLEKLVMQYPWSKNLRKVIPGDRNMGQLNHILKEYQTTAQNLIDQNINIESTTLYRIDF